LAKAYLQSFIDIIEIDDQQVRIKGSKDSLEKAGEPATVFPVFADEYKVARQSE
jgi:hypothetical protein